jgi:hypothetical protein
LIAHVLAGDGAFLQVLKNMLYFETRDPKNWVATLCLPAQVCFVFAFCNTATAMTVDASGPDFYKVVRGVSSWNIVLEGPIRSGDAGRVERALSAAGTSGADVYISSPGGDMIEAMKIGRIIRKSGATTKMGSLRTDNTAKFGELYGLRHVSGQCFSACALVFMGGVYRMQESSSPFGVHRFSRSGVPAPYDLDIGQIVSANLVAYMIEMGIDPALIEIMVQEGSSGIRLLTNDELKRLRVVNDGRMPAVWSIELVPGGQYLRGSQITVYGEGKINLMCDGSEIVIFSIYEAGVERALSVARGGWFHSILIDGAESPLPDSVKPKAEGARIMTLFRLSEEQARATAKAKSIGHAMQVGRGAPTFVGYMIDVERDDRTRLRVFVENCLKS